MTRMTMALMAVATCCGAAFAQPAPGHATQAQCENYARVSAERHKRAEALGCPGWGKNPNWYEVDLKGCMNNPKETPQLLGIAEKNQAANLANCERTHKPGQGQTGGKGPSEQTCQNVMKTYGTYMNDVSHWQADCQKLAAAKKSTAADYNRYLTACNLQDKAGRNFYSIGCNKAYPNMPAPGQGPNTCAQQTKDNCPRVN